jgi:hypothetical protein
MDIPDVALLQPAVVRAPFAGAAAPPAPLTWGQRALWTAMRRRGPEQASMSMRRGLPLPRRAPDDVDSAVRAIGALVSRHSSLRTRIQVIDGEPRQIVAERGEQPVILVHAGAPDTDIADDVAAELAATPFEHAVEWPQRIALVLVAGRVRRIVLVFSHTTVDFQAVEILLRDLRVLLLRGAIPTPPGAQSVDIARLEQGVDRRKSDRAVAYWLRGFGRLPTQTLPWSGPPSTPRFRRSVLVSEAAGTAVRLAGVRHRVTGSTVLVAAAAAVICAWSGTGVCGIHSMANNRALPGYADAIAKLNQVGLIVVDTTDRPSLADLLPRVWQAAVEGYRHAHYDPARLRQEFEAAGYPYETGVSPHCFLNDLRLSTELDLFGRATGEAEVRAAMARSTYTVAEGFEHFQWRLRVQILDAPPGLALAVTADTAYLAPQAAERFLRDIERLLVEAAFGDVPWPWPSHASDRRVETHD